MEAAATTSRTEGPVDRAFHLLQVVVAAGEPLGVREIGRRTGLPRSTASRLVATLVDLRMVDRTASGSVIPGSALATLNAGPSTVAILRDRMHPLLVEIAQTFGENAALAVDDGDDLLYLSQVTSENPVSVSDVAGERHPFHLVAPGLVTMAGWSKERLDAYVDGGVTASTPHSVTDASAIRRRLKQISSDGYTWTDQELEVGVNGLAVPIIVDDVYAGSISLFGPSYRFSPESRSTVAEALVELIAIRLDT